MIRLKQTLATQIHHPRSPRATVLDVEIDAVNMRQALAHIDAELRSGRKGYVCLAGVHGIMEAYRDRALAQIFAEAALVMPDGMPTVWVGRHQGHHSMERVAGPDLMLEVMAGTEFRNSTHFLCGGKAGVAEELRDTLRSRFPQVKIVGTHTPPFGPMSTVQERQLTTKINRLKPDIIWVGISTPKQERFMARYLAQFDTKLMFGVGAAFDFHTGRIKDCPEWVKLWGLQWLDRLLQDPRHLWKRHLRNNPAFLAAIALQLMGLRSYPRKPEPAAANPKANPCVEFVESQTQ
ncbi:N-acetylglucosaminyldiphosphoundecaprenol N-acetyl-beta-D-mannosaminyltransferase [Granulicella aggregans]|uniref:N-acetylglucosaminyldiphosphoundecaprenol N-acetyl-beta-D-mannosaminyltransferase n=1 Tax=Granulicella aggregans TaxID=474949 RepID=A0A7W7ZH81_9BACT|nr:WecB/TagA/CpsF family glycosyltransferase [Granulicella aggregans]MBB5059683.1 N-acetylglucosaminyldiphosphoundecaprenol N-acetyl-beta-D-mannosaminyltransferase [Granulicella aggregans]